VSYVDMCRATVAVMKTAAIARAIGFDRLISAR